MRRNIKLNYGNDKSIYLYTHWGAEGLEGVLANSLDRARERWSDPAYLARIIFTDMTADVGDSLTGYGLSVVECDPEFKTLEVDLEGKKVNGIDFDVFIKNPSMFKID